MTRAQPSPHQMGIDSARLGSGVPYYSLPLDQTNPKWDEFWQGHREEMARVRSTHKPQEI